MPTTRKLDLYKQHASDYVAPKIPRLVTIPLATYFAITGKGQPGGVQFVANVGALYGVAFTVKMQQKSAGRDYAVCKLEGLWWGKTSQPDGFGHPRDHWHWKLLIRTPDWIRDEDRRQAIESLGQKGKGYEAKKVRLETLEEGQCVQLLHVGPYTEEAGTIARMKEFAAEQGLAFRGRHHEIYLSDPRKVAASRLRTILRHPVR